jgi:hypothetical protein
VRELDEQQWTALRQALAAAVAAHAPEWTDATDSDPGIAILQLFAHLVEAMQARGPVPDGALSSASRIVGSLTGLDDGESPQVSVDEQRWMLVRSLADAAPDDRVFSVNDAGAIVFGDGEHGRLPAPGSRVAARFGHGGGAEGTGSITVRTGWPFSPHRFDVVLGPDGSVGYQGAAVAASGWSGTKRPRHFDGRLLTAADFADEQAYLVKKHRLHQTALHGSGIVQGLQVQGTDAGNAVTVGAGLALDREGREIVVAAEALVPVSPATALPAYVVVEYAERRTDPVPSAVTGEFAPSRIEEGYRVLLTSAGAETGIAVARLIDNGSGWRLDESFEPRCVR